jgi:ppGpp synthetase/RelA/SpoT-type nucleotidyltranferase
MDINKLIEETDNTLAVINNWRASHSYPLLILKKTLHYRAKKTDEIAVVAQRLKRLNSISHKLQRNAHMKLSLD